MKKMLSVMAVVAAVVVLSLTTTSCKSNKPDQKSAQNAEVADSVLLLLMEPDSVSVAPCDSSSSVEVVEEDVEAEKPTPPYTFRVKNAKDICEAYWNVMSSEQEDAEEYFLFDITRDGIPELWLKVGTCEANYDLVVYRWRVGKGAQRIYTTDGGHSAFYRGKNYVLRQIAHMLTEWWTTFSYRGKIIERDIYEADLINEGLDEYKEPKEEFFEMLPATDKALLQSCFGL